MIFTRCSAEEVAKRTPHGRFFLTVPRNFQRKLSKRRHLAFTVFEIHFAFDCGDRTGAIELRYHLALPRFHLSRFLDGLLSFSDDTGIFTSLFT